MNIAKKIKELNKKYIKELNIALKVVKPYLIKAFTKFYGKEYEGAISNTINKISFNYFISKSYLEAAYSYKGVYGKRYNKILNYYFKFLDRLEDDSLSIDELGNLLLKNGLDKEQIDLYNFYNVLDMPFFTILKKGDLNYEKYIFLSIFAINLDVVIHEINHALMIEVVALVDDFLVTPQLFLYVESEEIFNDFITSKILDIYLNENYPLPFSLNRFTFQSEWEQHFYLIDLFYYVFEQVIKKSIMTKNFNLLWNYAGTYDFKLFCFLVQKYYFNKGCSEDEYQALLDLVFKMQNHALNIKALDYDAYFKELENKGYLVRKLN